MGVLDPIASDIGHGQLGVRSGLRLLDKLVQTSASQKHAFAELRGGKLLTPASWSVHSGSVYKIPIDETFKGRRLDVVSVRLATETLTRVESIADVVAGAFFFDPDATAASNLYVRLSDSTNPASGAVIAVFGFYYGSARVVQPTLGPDKMVDGAMDVWASATALTNYTTAGASGASGASVNRDSSIVAEGSYSARLEGTVVPGGFFPLYPIVSLPAVAGARYRWSALYRTDAANPAQVLAQIRVNTGTADIAADGRSSIASASAPITLASTYGEWMRFAFDFRADTASILPIMLLAASGATGTGKVWFDGHKIQRIYRFEEHDPRISYDALPMVAEGRKTIYFDRFQVGQGSFGLDNNDGHAEDLFGSYDFTNSQMYLRVGGRYADGGNEILTEDQFVRRWFMRKPLVSDAKVTTNLDDARQIYKEKLPAKKRGLIDSPNMAQRDIGRARPIVLGSPDTTRTGLAKMARLAKTTGFTVLPNGDGIYEWCDPDFVVQAASDANVYDGRLYLDEPSADKYDPVQSAAVQIFAGPCVSVTESSGTLLGAGRALLNGIANANFIHIEAGKNDLLDFDEGGAALVATVAPGYYLPTNASLFAAITAALQAAGTGTYGCARDVGGVSPEKIFVQQTAGSGVFNIRLTNTAPNRDRSAWPFLGFTGKVDRTAALKYIADASTFTDVDSQTVLRVSLGGVRDDSSGTYTGVANAYIEKPGDILAFLLRKAFNVPVEQIDLAALAAVRTGADPLWAYLGCPGEDSLEFGTIVERIENSNGIELLMDGDRWTFRKRDSSTPAGITELFDRDIIGEPVGWYDEDDVRSVVIVQSDQDPSTGRFPATTYNSSTSTLCAEMKARLGRDKEITFPTYLRSGAAVSYVNQLVANATARRRRFKFTVKSACLKKIPGDKVKLSRTKFVGRTNAAPSVVLRILNISHNLQNWESTLECAEVLTGTDQW